MQRGPGPARQGLAGADFCSSSSANGTPGDGSPDVSNRFGWCLTAGAEATSGGHRLSLLVCRDESGDGRLSFNDSLETDLAILAGDREVWRWSAGQAKEGPTHSLGIGSSQCVSWAVDWTDVDRSGRSLPPGDYRLIATTLAEELQDSPSESATLRVT
jgi:Intracellular proteinase inhibitor